LQLFDRQFGIAQNALYDLGMQNLGGVKRHGRAFAGSIFLDHMAAALSRE
jgi:hypothetical protein